MKRHFANKIFVPFLAASAFAMMILQQGCAIHGQSGEVVNATSGAPANISPSETPASQTLQSADDEMKALRERLDECETTARELQRKNESLTNRLREALQWRMVRELEEETSKLRGLAVKKHVAMQSINKAETRKLIARLLEREMPNELALTQGRTLSILGALPPGADLRAIVQNLYSEQVGGLYDDSTGKLYVTSLFEPSSRTGRVILSHEICHALQDQHFDFSKWPLHIHDNDDRVIAAACAAEGDATILMMDYIRANASLAWLAELPAMMTLDQRQLNAAPPFLQYSLVFPYLEGMRFLMTVQMRGGQEARDAALSTPPSTTAQVLHPEKFFAKPAEGATSAALVNLAPALGAGWRIRGQNTFGEAGIRAVLLPRNKPLSFRYFSMNPLQVPLEIELAAEGWAGDRLSIYMKDTVTSGESEATAIPTAAAADSTTSESHAIPAIVQWRMDWETPGDADQFVRYATQSWIPRILPGAHETQADAIQAAALATGGVAAQAPKPTSLTAWRSTTTPGWAILRRENPKTTELWISDSKAPVPLVY